MNQANLIRAIHLEDYDDLIELWRSARLDHRPLGRDSRSELSKQITCFPDMCWGVFKGDRLIASVIVSCDGRKGWINRLAVHPDFRAQGIAKALILHAESVLEQSGIFLIGALIEQDNIASRNLFDSLDYEQCTSLLYYRKKIQNDY